MSQLTDYGLVGTCSLFSPMSDFTDHEAAQLAAQSAADGLFAAEEPPPAPTVSRRQLLRRLKPARIAATDQNE